MGMPLRACCHKGQLALHIHGHDASTGPCRGALGSCRAHGVSLCKPVCCCLGEGKPQHLPDSHQVTNMILEGQEEVKHTDERHRARVRRTLHVEMISVSPCAAVTPVRTSGSLFLYGVWGMCS